MSGSTSKKVVIRRFEREPLSGFVNPGTYLKPTGVELISLSGTVALVPYDEVKGVCFVRDFEFSDTSKERKIFLTRPKAEGLWVRMRLRDGEVMDGLLANDLLRLEMHGFTLVPPDASSHQRVFIPNAALAELKVLSVVGSPLRRRKTKVVPKEQMEMF